MQSTVLLVGTMANFIRPSLAESELGASEPKIAAFACILTTDAAPRPVRHQQCFDHYNFSGKICRKLAADGGSGNLRLYCKL
jgi:hypothetical protein